MKKLLLAAALIPALTYAQDAPGYKLKGELKMKRAVRSVVLQYSDGKDRHIDSVVMKGGNDFKFEGALLEPTVAYFVVNYASGTPAREYMKIFLEPSKIEIKAQDSLGLHSITSPNSVDFERLDKAAEAADKDLELLYLKYKSASEGGRPEEAKRYESEIDAMEQRNRETVYGDFVRNNPNSPVAIYALTEYAGYQIDPVKVEPLIKLLPLKSQNSTAVLSLKDLVAKAKATAVGMPAPEFTQNDTLGNPVSLSSFRGKYVLVDFWASWCGPCRRENPNVVANWQKYHDKGFTVLGVSLDQPNAKEKWLAAIHKDNLTWTHVSDLQFWDNAVAKQYGIRSIPQNFLIGPDGKIVARDLRGEDLGKKLEELLK